MSSRGGSTVVSRGVSLNFDAEELVYDDEAEYQREDEQQQHEVRRVFFQLLWQSLKKKWLTANRLLFSMGSDTNSVKVRHHRSQRQFNVGRKDFYYLTLIWSWDGLYLSCNFHWDTAICRTNDMKDNFLLVWPWFWNHDRSTSPILWACNCDKRWSF